MKVALLTHTNEALSVLFTAARTCYSASTAEEIWQAHDGYSADKMLGVVRGCIKRGHNSVIRHASFTFAIDGISRACANQLTRHGPGWAFDQQSLRYVKVNAEPNWVIPENQDDMAIAIQRASANRAWLDYKALMDSGVPAEDARSVLPLCTPTNLVATCNLAALLHFYGVRFVGDTGKPQDEIKQLCADMVRLVVDAEPWLAEFFQGVAA